MFCGIRDDLSTLPVIVLLHLCCSNPEASAVGHSVPVHHLPPLNPLSLIAHNASLQVSGKCY